MAMNFPAAKQGPLDAGDRLHDLAFLDPKGRAFSLYHDRIFGWPKVIHLAATPDAAAGELQRLAGLAEAFGQAETQVLAITRAPPAANAAVAERLGLPFPLLSDPEGALHRAAGLEPSAGAVTMLFDPCLRLERVVGDGEGESQAEAALAHARTRARARQPSVVALQAPVLAVPNVIDPDHCRRLMAFWESGQKIDNSVVSSAQRSNRANARTKARTDVILHEDTPESRDLVEVLRRRLLPEVLKGFGFRVSRMETFRVGCYDSRSGGYFAPHRDNTTALTRHRRYALTLNLNTGDYEGGFLRFPEYGPQLYAPPPGGAVVFHCSLLHFVLPVTRGRRFVVVGFFWGEEEQKLYERTLSAQSLEPSLSR
jgi:peroxiredoxin/predicted 2-oxoglutarate/Fe(II)-dependent dioxygenase YbiX